MFGVSDTLEAILGAETALIILTLAAVDYVQVRYLDSRLDKFEGRVTRLEDVLLNDPPQQERERDRSD